MLSRPSRFRVALLCSRHAPGLEHLLDDPLRGVLYDLVACVCSERDLPPEARPVDETGLPFLSHPVRDFHRSRRAPLRDHAVCALYDRTMVELLAEVRPDLVLLDGYRYVVTAPMLEAFPDRILNVHHSDLTQRDDRGRPRYPGLRVVHAAVLCGETERAAFGPLLVRSVELLSRGRVQVVGGTAWIDGAPGPLDLTWDGGLATPRPPRGLARWALAN